MYDLAAISSWIEFAVRWVHVIVGIAWIGSSFYFIALDLGLHRDRNLKSGADGEEWQVHGGGFYHVQKYLVAPAQMPDDLVWFKWESYSTWLSGFALLILVYYFGAEFYLVDPAVADIGIPTAILISLASLAFGWLAYDFICKSKFGDDNTRLMIGLYVILVAMAYFYTSVFSGRAALLHLGAFTATIMSGNVFFTIMPNQRIVVADLQAGRTPDAKYGKIAKQRSTHNNYLTLPVIFLMLSNHYPLAFASEANWIIASLVFLMGVTIRHYFNTIHMRKGDPIWTWLVTAILFIVIMWLSTAPMFRADEPVEAKGPALRFAQADGFENVQNIVTGRCSMCHAAEPVWDGMHWPPKGVRLETEHQIAMAAKQIYLQAGLTHAMPPANLSYMQESERAQIVAWYRAATSD
ncbi:urate hydroxylase PuuD [Sulfitobacter geojensis]|uniref:Urate hydroxylase PuuD n=1 Tax=Sulfitobacter geojensis TaxID=1342299 RepID=A0AAE2VYL0_9RHOB|nr:urate hydroxylase PuuD [Sulfitobacter geojensis]MBM1689800.1 urate hydroxylase PuuD [Sulfitobacter geojensis]MBM1693866.1 urate hydroxylase PuuD [Sulfitobacter geojensis]MBM1706032.1 urate hydroxylase PuuD [Sulfitobacter geojensis]MBM1710090.1 urate hydroxylase PuuD [Sulfitobacter geojensis]MBM1714156.1 urate hydroxylase PuuD [Sulfitobacter geojensis]